MGLKEFRGVGVQIGLQKLLGGGYIDLAVLYSQVIAVQHQGRNGEGGQA